MVTKNVISTTALGVIVVLAVVSITGLNNAFSEETKYSMVNDVQAIFTFEFKDGVEIIEFPVFQMEDNYINNNVSPTFSVEGVVGSYPHLHRALDDAFKYKQNPSYEWNYQLFNIDVEFVKDGTVVRVLPYHDCYVEDYKVKTLTDAYESYLSSKSGFTVVDDIDFQCGGLNSFDTMSHDKSRINFSATEYEQTSFTFAENVRTFVTFEFDEGIEVIEFPVFHTNAGFEESSDNVPPGFFVENTINKHSLLDKAIEKSRKNGGIAYGVNVDFEATVDFKKDDTVLRTLEYKDCRVSSGKIITQTDKEEGFTGKSGFAFVEQIDFQCIGLDTIENTHGKNKNVGQMSKTMVENTLPSHEYPLGTGPRVVATFTYDDGIEVIDFPIFDQGKVLVKSSPTFELGGIVGYFPMLYKVVDDSLALTSTTGSNNFLNLFQVDVELKDGDKSIRGFNYVDCRVIDYNVKTQQNKEESYFKGFALSNTFEFECQGYHPNNPVYDSMFNNAEKAKTTSSADLRDTSDWGPGFYHQ